MHGMVGLAGNPQPGALMQTRPPPNLPTPTDCANLICQFAELVVRELEKDKASGKLWLATPSGWLGNLYNMADAIAQHVHASQQTTATLLSMSRRRRLGWRSPSCRLAEVRPLLCMLCLLCSG